MLYLKTLKGWFPLENRQNFCVVSEYDGLQSLSFDIVTSEPHFLDIKEEATLKFEDNFYTIKTINRRKKIASILAELDMDEWKSAPYVNFQTEDKLCSEVMDLIKPDGWLIEATGSVSKRVSLSLEGVTAYDIFISCMEAYDIVFEYHIADKRIKVIKPNAVLPRGLFMSDELNLSDVEYKGSSQGIVTLLQAHGKKTEIKDEEGNVLSVEYVTFKDLNDGKDYIENHDYTDKVIGAYWHDDKYTDPQALYDDAYDKLKQMAIPTKSYGCKLYDLSRTNPDYKILDFKMYDKPMLIDASGIHEQHQIVQYKRYPDQEQNNEVVLSTSFQKITGKIENLNSSINKIDVELGKKENIINELIHDVDSNTSRIENTYTKGETDVTITSVVQQAKDEINTSIQRVEEDTKQLEKRVDNTEQQVTPEQITNTVSSQFYKKDETDLMYSSKSEVSSQIKQLKDSISITLKEMSGFNFLYNSSGWNSTNFWYGQKNEDGSHTNVIGSVKGEKNNDIQDHTVSGSAFHFEKGTMRQDVHLTPGNMYTLSCLSKRYLSACSCKIIQNDVETTLFSFDETYTDEDWHAYCISFECLSSLLTIEITSSDKYLMIADIMLNDGVIQKTWTSNGDEIYAGSVKIDKDGIRISQTESNTETIIDSTEFAVVYTETGQRVVRVNKDTTVLQKVIAEDDLTIGNVKIIKRANGIDFAVIE